MIRTMARITLCCLLLQLAACESTRFVPVNTVVNEKKEKLGTPPGLHIAGYVTRDGANHPFDGTVMTEGDSFVFHRNVSSEEAADTTAAARAQRAPFRLPQAQVTELNAFQRSHGLLVIGACAAMAAGPIWMGDAMSGN
jgi:hypothetical protein